MRLNKFLASIGVCSRREADRAIEANRVMINGETAELGAMVGEEDLVSLDGRYIATGKDVEKVKPIIIAFNKPAFKGEKIELEGNEVNMTLKFEEAQTALIYYSSLLNMKNKAFPVGDNNEISLKNIKMISEKEITDDYAVFKILSPICLKCHSRENKKDRYLTVEDNDFALELARKLKDDIPYMEEEIDTLRYDLSGLKKIIVPVYGLKIPVSIGNFIISGDKKILNHILKTGIGSKRNSGFGLVEQIV